MLVCTTWINFSMSIKPWCYIWQFGHPRTTLKLGKDKTTSLIQSLKKLLFFCWYRVQAYLTADQIQVPTLNVQFKTGHSNFFWCFSSFHVLYIIQMFRFLGFLTQHSYVMNSSVKFGSKANWSPDPYYMVPDLRLASKIFYYLWIIQMFCFPSW